MSIKTEFQNKNTKNLYVKRIFKVKCMHFVSFNFCLQKAVHKKIYIILRKQLQKDPSPEGNYITKFDISENLVYLLLTKVKNFVFF